MGQTRREQGMGVDSEGSRNSAADVPKPVRRLQTNVRTLIVLVACAAAIFWTWRRLAENSDPVHSEARSIQKQAIAALHSARPAERLTAIQELERLQVGDRSVAIPALIGALADPDTTVRLVAVQALEWVGPSVIQVKSGSRCRNRRRRGAGPRRVFERPGYGNSLRCVQSPGFDRLQRWRIQDRVAR